MGPHVLFRTLLSNIPKDGPTQKRIPFIKSAPIKKKINPKLEAHGLQPRYVGEF
jgi:hypothetical protein